MINFFQVVFFGLTIGFVGSNELDVAGYKNDTGFRLAKFLSAKSFVRILEDKVYSSIMTDRALALVALDSATPVTQYSIGITGTPYFVLSAAFVSTQT